MYSTEPNPGISRSEQIDSSLSPEGRSDGQEQSSVYAVSETAGILKIKSVPISKESAKAVFLGDSILLPSSDHPKRLLIKGNDLIARSKEEALSQYIISLQNRLVELEKTRINTEELLRQAAEFRI